MKPPTSGWPLRAYEAMRRRDKAGFELALLRYSMTRDDQQAQQLALGLLDLLPAEERNWWMATDAALPSVDVAGHELFARLLEQIAAQRDSHSDRGNA